MESISNSYTPFCHPPIHPCNCGAFDGMIGDIHMPSVVLAQTDEGWYKVVCMECLRESKVSSKGQASAIKLWNEEMESDNHIMLK